MTTRLDGAGSVLRPELARCPHVTIVSVKLRYNYRIVLGEEHRVPLAKAFGCARVVYNDGISARSAAYSAQLPFISDATLQKIVITQAKKTPEREWLGEVSSVVLVQSLGDLHAAYRNFFGGLKGRRTNGQKMGPPRRKKKSSTASIRFTRNGFSLRPDGKLYLAKIGSVKVRWSRPLPAEPSSVTVIREADGKLYASFVVDADPQPLPEADAETGIDLGLSSYAISSDGHKITSPKFFRRMERKLRRAQRDLSRKQGGSANRRKAKVAVAKVHARVRERRADFIHQETWRIVRDNQAVYVEDLAVKAMASRKGRRGKSLADASLGAFTRTLEGKCARYGRYFGKVDRFFPSTQMCSACGSVEGPKGLEDLSARAWSCSCGAVHDRDVNAAKNILAAGQADRLNACGAQVRPPVAEAPRDEAGSRANREGSVLQRH